MGEVELVLDVLDAFNRRDFEAVAAGYHEHAWVRYPQSGELIEGRERLMGMLNASQRPPTWTVTKARSLDRGAIVETDADYGTGGIWKTVFIYEIDEGLITSEVAYFGPPFDPAESRAPFVTLEGRKI